MKISSFTVFYLIAGMLGMALQGIYYFANPPSPWGEIAWAAGSIVLLADLFVAAYKYEKEKNTKTERPNF